MPHVLETTKAEEVVLQFLKKEVKQVQVPQIQQVQLFVEEVLVPTPVVTQVAEVPQIQEMNQEVPKVEVMYKVEEVREVIIILFKKVPWTKIAIIQKYKMDKVNLVLKVTEVISKVEHLYHQLEVINQEVEPKVELTRQEVVPKVVLTFQMIQMQKNSLIKLKMPILKN